MSLFVSIRLLFPVFVTSLMLYPWECDRTSLSVSSWFFLAGLSQNFELLCNPDSIFVYLILSLPLSVSIRLDLSCCYHFFNALSLRMWSNKFICVLLILFSSFLSEFFITLQLLFNYFLAYLVFVSFCLCLILLFFISFNPDNVIVQVY